MCVTESPKKREFARLPTNVKPIKYTLDFDVIDLDRCRFEGTEKIDVAIVEDTTTITCHAVELWVDNVSIAVEGGKAIAVDEIRYTKFDEAVTFVFPSVLPAGATATLTLSFHGILNDKLKGFYRSEYTQNGERRVMAVTQFEACDARRAFVCWDEPAIKAKFQISMVTPVDREAISNTHVLSTLVRPVKNAHITKHAASYEKKWCFAETPIMSTYLVGMVVGEFDYVSAYTAEGVLVRVYTPVGRSERGRFALNVATKCLSFFTHKFGIPYPLTKLDMLAIPDFNAGAMENWGVVTYREMRLLIDERESSIAQKTATARTVCHELAHQWFGNLVTMEWWTSLWLNEGFARFMEFDAVDHIFPEWNMWTSFVQDITMGLAMAKDAMLTSHPIEVEVHHPDEVDQIFDTISYAKGASVIRMLANVVGLDQFYAGVHNYLVAHSYGNAVTEDLWDAFEAASGMQITAMANMWTKQTGFPVLTVTRGDGATLQLSQTRFLAFGDDVEGSKWDVPVTLATPDATSETAIWAHADETFSLDLPDAPWYKLNANQTGFYLVNYPAEDWTALQAPVQSLALGVVDRVSLLSSVFMLARAGVVGCADALAFSTAFASEPEYLCWKELSENLQAYTSLFHGDECTPALRAYIQGLYANVHATLGWDPLPTDVEMTSNFRRIVLAMLGGAKDPAVLAEASRRFHAGGLSADLRSVVYSLHARQAGREAFDYFATTYTSSDFIEEQLDCLANIGKVPGLKAEALAWGVASVRAQDIQYVFSSVASDMVGAALAWDYVQENWEALNAKFTPIQVGRILASSIARFQSEERATEVEAFLATRQHPAYARSVDATLERIRTRAAMYARDQDGMRAWLATLA
ncbi:puromycin-sensitive aminopeptidase [Achlya hypogyna]|uniref:Aminopeptidase n=1 Tax=Achlya hypogyna TaxID=1202772 RepID=A0A1V9YWU6_ACHHY|nr:puromycin-sensitive aminopeptidase [Achlya hypogyna]